MQRSSVLTAAGLLLAGVAGMVIWKILPGPDAAPATGTQAATAAASAGASEVAGISTDDGPAPVIAEATVKAWQSLSPGRRAEIRARYAALSALSDSERKQLAEAAARFDALPAAERERLQATFDAQDRLVRHGWRLGPALGADYAGLHPLLAFVPEAQHDALLQAVRSMAPAERASLAVLIQRTPPQDRQALRDALLAEPAAARGQWLASRLQQ